MIYTSWEAEEIHGLQLLSILKQGYKELSTQQQKNSFCVFYFQLIYFHAVSANLLF